MAEFTGERLIPGQVDVDLLNEHMARYAFAARLARGKRVLDAGCGAGYGSAELAQAADSVVGADVAAAVTCGGTAADGIAITIGNDVIAPLRREEFTPSRAGIATGAGVKTSTNDRRNNVLRTREHAHALYHGGAID